MKAYKGEHDPRFRGRLVALVITNEATMTHQPAERALHYPAPGKHFETCDVVRAFHHLNLSLRMALFSPFGKILPCISTVDPDLSQTCEPSGHSFGNRFHTLSLRATGRGDNDSEQHPEYVDKQMAFAPLYFLATVVGKFAAMSFGL